MNHMRAVIWPRGKDDEALANPNHRRYAIVGVLVTDKPIPQLEGVNETMIDGFVPGLDDVLGLVHRREPKIHVGDATNVLLQLDLF